MKAVVIGTGRIACGVAGELFRAAGMEVVFAGRNAEMVDRLNAAGSYTVRVVDNGTSEDIVVDGVRAVMIGDAAKEIADADIIATAIGCQNLPAVAPLLAGTRANVLAFENFCGAPPRGFTGALVTRVV